MSDHQAAAHYTEGVCEDGAAILQDGAPMPISSILSTLNEIGRLRAEAARYDSPAWEANERLNAVVDAQAAEIERLRIFLRSHLLAEGKPVWWGNEP